MGVALRAESDDGDGLAVEQREVSVVVVEHGAAGYRKRRAPCRAKRRVPPASVKLAAWPVRSDDGYFPRGTSVLRRGARGAARRPLLRPARARDRRAAPGQLHRHEPGDTRARERPFRRLARTGERLRDDLLRHARARPTRAREGAQAARARARRAAPRTRAVPRRHAVRGVRPRADAVDRGGHRRVGAVLLRAVRAAAERRERDALLAATTCASASCSGCRATSRRRRTRRSAPGGTSGSRATSMHLTDEARYMGARSRSRSRCRRCNQPAKRLHDLVMLGSLPPRVRELYGLSWSPRQARAFRGRGRRAARAAARRAARGRGSGCERAQLRARARRPSSGGSTRGRPTPQLPPLPARARAACAPLRRSRPRRARRRASRSAPSGAANGAVAVVEPLHADRSR